MDKASLRLIERYQAIFQKDPKSKVFATLADAYRKLEMLDDAEKICRHGLQHNPNFVPGRVVMAKILIQRKRHDVALKHLEDAVKLDPENILAHSLLAETLLRLKRPRDAMQAYKMVLYFNPFDAKASQVVKKLESLTADEYEDDIFQMQNIDTVTETLPQEPAPEISELEAAVQLGNEPGASGPGTKEFLIERFLSLFDAFLVRNDLVKAEETLQEAFKNLGEHKELRKRLAMLENRAESVPESTPVAARDARFEKEKIVLVDAEEVERETKISYLQELLARIQKNKARIEA